VASRDQTLTALRRYDDPVAGIFEEFAERRLGPGRALALVAGPLADRRSTAWVICPTIGPEHGNLRRLEAIVARRLAGGGFDVVRIRPDTHSLHGEISLPTRLAEVEEAVDLLAERGHTSIGAIGVLFGGTVAALAAERLGLAALALVEPFVRGRQYARALLRREAVAQLVAAEEPDGEGPMHELAATGRANIRGLRLTKEAHDLISAVDLPSGLRSFAGRSIVLGISPSGQPPPGLRKFRDRLVELGGDVTIEGIADPLYAPLGEYYYRDAGLLRIDTRLELDGKVADRLSAWALGEATVGPAA
jgi:pimeloyl-ACP methyl ester carboxylesterase